MDAVDVVAGVQRFQLRGGHTVVVRDLAPGIALDDGVGHLAGLGGVQQLRDRAEIHHALGRDIALRNADIFDKVDRQRIGGDIHLLDLLEQLVQRTGILRRADKLIVDIERVAIGHLPKLFGKVLLEGGRVRHIAAPHKGGRIVNGVLCDLIALAERLGRDALELGRSLACLRRAGDRVDHIAVVLHRCAQRVEGKEDRDRSHNRRAADKIERVDAPCAAAPAVRVRTGSMVALAAAHLQLLVQQRVPHREHPADDEKDLHQKAVGFGEVARLALAHHRAGARPDAADALPQRCEKEGRVCKERSQPFGYSVPAAPLRGG